MPSYPLFLVDAFTDTAFEGNACAVVLNAAPLTPARCLAIAREMNQAETAFVRDITLTGDQTHVTVRYYTPAEEIPVAGHPTIATAAVLASIGAVPYASEFGSIVFNLRDHALPIAIERQHDQLLRVRTPLPAPVFGRCYASERVARVFGLSADDLLPNAPVQTVDAGTPQLMVPVRDHGALERATLVPSSYTALRAEGDFFSPHLFCLGGMSPAGATAARHFGIAPDLPEDPVTGSATGAMAAYLWAYRLIQSPVFIAEQGYWMGRPGRVHVQILGPPTSIRGIVIGGTAIVVSEGSIWA